MDVHPRNTFVLHNFRLCDFNGVVFFSSFCVAGMPTNAPITGFFYVTSQSDHLSNASEDFFESWWLCYPAS